MNQFSTWRLIESQRDQLCQNSSKILSMCLLGQTMIFHLALGCLTDSLSLPCCHIWSGLWGKGNSHNLQQTPQKSQKWRKHLSHTACQSVLTAHKTQLSSEHLICPQFNMSTFKSSTAKVSNIHSDVSCAVLTINHPVVVYPYGPSCYIGSGKQLSRCVPGSRTHCLFFPFPLME